jgi:uncharacterized metal-binding protein YceD (DUF177 family)
VGKGVFDIDIYKLTDGNHEFDFEFDSRFFDLFEDSIIKNGAGEVKVLLDKTASMLLLTFKLDAEIELTCDRSLDLFMHQVKESNDVRLKYGDHWEELNDDLILIPVNTQKVDVAQFVYEFLTLAIPMKKLHPKFQDEEEFISMDESDSDSSSDQPIDPRWNELKKLKNN